MFNALKHKCPPYSINIFIVICLYEFLALPTDKIYKYQKLGKMRTNTTKEISKQT